MPEIAAPAAPARERWSRAVLSYHLLLSVRLNLQIQLWSLAGCTMELDLSAPYSDLSEPTTPSGNLVDSESTTSGFPEARTDHQAGSTENGTAKKQKSCAPCRIRRVK